MNKSGAASRPSSQLVATRVKGMYNKRCSRPATASKNGILGGSQMKIRNLRLENAKLKEKIRFYEANVGEKAPIELNKNKMLTQLNELEKQLASMLNRIETWKVATESKRLFNPEGIITSSQKFKLLNTYKTMLEAEKNQEIMFSYMQSKLKLFHDHREIANIREFLERGEMHESKGKVEEIKQIRQKMELEQNRIEEIESLLKQQEM